MGPLERRLYLRAAAILSIPPGGGIQDGIAFFLDAKRRARIMLEAREWKDKAIAAVRAASDADEAWTNEAIAGRILEKIAERDRAAKERRRLGQDLED